MPGCLMLLPHHAVLALGCFSRACSSVQGQIVCLHLEVEDTASSDQLYHCRCVTLHWRLELSRRDCCHLKSMLSVLAIRLWRGRSWQGTTMAC